MLAGDFFTIKAISATENSVSATLILNATHRVYDGHFPGMPVVPGVCQVQMIKEVIETHLQKKLRLVNAKDIKFLSMILPGENAEIACEISYLIDAEGSVSVNASLALPERNALKIKTLLKVA